MLGRMKNKNKEIIVYGLTRFSSINDEAVLAFRKDGFHARVLAVGWNEWAHMITYWLPEPEWKTIQIQRYISASND